MDTVEWKAQVKQILKAEMARRGLTYGDLVDRLSKINVEETESAIKVKMSRGTFSAVWFLQCLKAIECKEIKLDI